MTQFNFSVASIANTVNEIFHKINERKKHSKVILYNENMSFDDVYDLMIYLSKALRENNIFGFQCDIVKDDEKVFLVYQFNYGKSFILEYDVMDNRKYYNIIPSYSVYIFKEGSPNSETLQDIAFLKTLKGGN